MNQDQKDLEEENPNLKSQIKTLQDDNASEEDLLSSLHWLCTTHLRCVQNLHGNGIEAETKLLAELVLGLEAEVAAIERRMPRLTKERNSW